MSEHTPGPWTGFLGSDGCEQSWLIGAVDAHPIVAYVKADEESGLTGPTVEANARLVAAAPDLLKEARDFIAWINGAGSGTDLDLATHLLKLQVAINRAEGREQP